MEIKQEISDLVEKIIKSVKVKKIILFGSYAKGTPTKESDIDLCIITNEQKTYEVDWKVREAILGYLKIPIDILVYNENNFENRANSNTSFEHQILKEGVLIYE